METHILGKCPHCEADYRLRAHAAGRRARCKTCGEVFVIPGERKPLTVDDDVAGWLAGAQSDDETRQEDNEDDEDDADSLPDPALIQAQAQSTGTRPPAH